ncbi:Na+/H+ antiporter NhaA [Zeaxanthinibacter enoshimensis]|uniref:Na(+)/H(+) antiporter NhaA n=1 Tax=Zeaxanthinibacter enoshimensis TaxID=392009 RepID=A0A4R6THJ8_9FLAO|nr:Na+/H+ antiporter NhaA [Zeaxanthinibacter enoshimensis]TDQ29363.1 NhaA family Na+:H+ antiporter [Zeaxanthinibacter enoshimensis]
MQDKIKLKEQPIDRFYRYVRFFFDSGTTLGTLLMIMVIIAMFWANSPWTTTYHQLFETKIAIGYEGFRIEETLRHWINDFLMAYFFFLVGLEIKREFIDGHLSTIRRASGPLIGALGGMILPALIFLAITWGTPAVAGWGIPMATDIAFAVGFLSLASGIVKRSGKPFLTALAAADDIGAILVIAFFLTTGIDMGNLLAALVYFLIMLGGNFMGIRNTWFYLIVGIFGLWVALLLSGVHATLAGILAALCIPARTKITEESYKEVLVSRSEQFASASVTPTGLLTAEQVKIIQGVIRDSKRALTPLQRIEKDIKPFVNFLVLPVFALANSGISLEGNLLKMITHPLSLGIMAGLVFGKLFGILTANYFASKLGLSQLPEGMNWKILAGLSSLAGIGFTMSLFIAGIVFKEPDMLAIAKIGVLAGSAISAILAISWLRYASNKTVSGT